MREGYDRERELEEEFKMPARCLHIYATDGESRCDADDEPMLRRAVLQRIEDGRDAILDFTTVYGADCSIILSTIVSWVVSTPESRALSRRMGEAIRKIEKDRDLHGE